MRKHLKKILLTLLVVILAAGAWLSYETYKFAQAFAPIALEGRKEISEFEWKLGVSIPTDAINPKVIITGFTDVSQYARYELPPETINERLKAMSDEKVEFTPSTRLQYNWNYKNKLWSLKNTTSGYYIETRNHFTFIDVDNNCVYTSYYTW